MHSRLKLDISWASLLWATAGPPASASRVADAEACLSRAFGERDLVVGLSVRTIFDALLTELALPLASSVLMSGVNIQNMADIVAAHDLRIAAVDVDCATLAPPQNALLEAQAATGAKICVVTQLFGAVNVVSDAAQLRGRGVLVVEDAAQAFAGDFHHGRPEVDVSLFSFGPIKRCTALGGAIATFRDPELAVRVRERLRSYQARGEGWFRRRAAKYLMIKAASAPLFYGAVMSTIAASGRDADAIIGKAARGFSGASLMQAIKGRPPNRMIVLMARQIVAAANPKLRQEICRQFLEGLPDTAGPGFGAQSNAFWLMPLFVKNPKRFIELLRAEGFDATRGATSLRALVPDQTPSARALIDNIVYLPHPADLNDRARIRLCEAVSESICAEG